MTPEQVAEMEAAQNLRSIMNGMPYSGSIAPLPMYDPQVGATRFLEEATRWLDALRTLLQVVGDTQYRSQMELDRLREERAIVRSFFGINERDS